MIYGLYLSAAGLQAQEARQTVTSNNLANAQTVGFKRDLAVMRARANAVDEDPRMAKYRVPVMDDQGGGVFAVNGGVDLSQGAFQTTGNKTDLALDGRGFFTVQGDKPGQKVLTRNGQFLLDAEGMLVTTKGRPVLSAAGEPIKLNPTLPVTVDKAGAITQGDAAGVKLGIVNVADPRRLVKLGGNLMTVDAPSAMSDAPAATAVRQGKLELSGVEPVQEMISMMEGQRAFEANARMITFQDQTLQQLNQIGRVA
jgi:flagellar basal-body rod protein FlgF